MLQGFNAWDLPYTNLLNPETQTIHGMFEHWAQHTPEAPALTFGVIRMARLTALSALLLHARAACKWLLRFC